MRKTFCFHSPFFIPLVCMAMLMASCGRDSDTSDATATLITSGYGHQTKADTLHKYHDNKGAFAEFAKAQQDYQQGKDSLRLTYVLVQMARILHENNDYIEMQAQAVEALKYVTDSTDSSTIYSIYNNLGISYAQLEQYDKAVAYYKKARSATKDAKLQINADNNIAYTLIASKKYDQAYELLNTLFRPPLKIYPETYARVQSNLGYAGSYLSKPGSVKFMENALHNRIASGDNSGAVTTYLQLAKALKVSDKGAAISYAKKAEKLAREIDAPDDRLLALEFLIHNDASGDIKSVSRTFATLTDSVIRARRNASNAFADIKYNVSLERERRLESEAGKARAEAEELRQRQVKWALVIVMVVVAVASVFGIRRFIRKAKKQRIEAAYESEVRLAEKLHDELANDMHQTMVFSESSDLSDAENKERLIRELDDIYQRTRDISRDNARIATKGDFREQLRELIARYQTDNCRIIATTLTGTNWELLQEHQLMAVYRSIQELLVNMKKHSGCSIAALQFSLIDKAFEMKYSDNGKGASEANVKNGLLIMENRIQALSGSVTFGTGQEKGFQAVIKFPL